MKMENLTKILLGISLFMLGSFFLVSCENHEKSYIKDFWKDFLNTLEKGDSILVEESCTERGFKELNFIFEENYEDAYSLLKNDKINISFIDNENKIKVIAGSIDEGLGFIFIKKNNKYLLDDLLPAK